MANSLNTNVSVAGNVNGLSINESAASTLVPIGSTAMAESTLISPVGVWNLIATGSGFGTASVIYCENTSQTSSITLALSASGVVNNLGTIAALPLSNTNGIGTLIQWNAPFSGLYALANVSASYGVFAIISQ